MDRKMESTMRDILAQEKAMIDGVCETLRGHSNLIRDNLAVIVASLCEIDVRDMLTRVDKYHISQSRWLYWLAYRRMFNESYDDMAQHLSKKGCTFTAQGIIFGVNKMLVFVERDPLWSHRWAMLKQILEIYQEG